MPSQPTTRSNSSLIVPSAKRKRTPVPVSNVSTTWADVRTMSVRHSNTPPHHPPTHTLHAYEQVGHALFARFPSLCGGGVLSPMRLKSQRCDRSVTLPQRHRTIPGVTEA
eukprot:8166138-Pyramimonas_sp.AAC.1